jgi:isopentenyl diphosphate isomerase/L-lactate dehydrogenase-like FMN-dependent dehydrogenase
MHDEDHPSRGGVGGDSMAGLRLGGLAALGQPGVEAIGSMFTREPRTIMRQAGAPGLAALDKGHLA